MRRRPPGAWSALAALAACAACTVTRDQPNLVGQDVRLTIIHTADIHSRLFPYTFVPNKFDQDYGLLKDNGPFGGAARMATIIKRERAAAGRSLWLDSGDSFQGAPIFNMFKGEAEMRFLSRAGLDGAVIGNHEFDLGTQNLFYQYDNWGRFPLLVANYLFEDPKNPQATSLRDVVQPYAVYDVDGLKVGVIGLGNWSSMTGIFEGGNSLGLRPIDESEVVDEYVRLLRPQVDVVVIVSHLGLDEDEGLSASDVTDQNEALPLDGVDVILGGHLHIVLNPPKSLPSDTMGHQTVLCHSGAFAKFVGRLDLVVHVGSDNSDPAQRSRVTAYTYKPIPIDSTVEDDADITDLLWPYSVALNREIDLQGVVSWINTSGTSKVVRNDPTGGDSQLGNLVARSMQLRTGIEAEIAMTNSLGIRADFEQGALTNEQMYNVFPFENTIAIMYLSGSEIQETLDFVARKSASRGCRAQAQVAGVTFDMVCSGDCPNGETACAKNIVVGENCRDGDPNGPVDTTQCRPLVPSGLYKVAVNDYIANGGSGFDVLKRNTSKQFTDISLRDALIDFLRREPVCPTDVLVDPAHPEKGTVRDVWGQVSCIDDKLEAHDGRIRPVFE
jgi:5'-nucleotidase / UDP-sugar diphosphatase